MIEKKEFPILEFDSNKEAVINPNEVLKKYKKLEYNKLVISFFKEAIDKLLVEGKITNYIKIDGENDIFIYKFTNCDVLLMHGQLGCPACAGWLDELTAFGIKHVMFCGGGGVLDKTIDVGKLMVVSGAIRDEGFSYHYLEPSRIVYSNALINKKITDYLEKNDIKYFTGLTWTTDAFFRETIDKVKLRKEEGARIVEMEQSGLIAVSIFRNINYGAIIYGGDDVSLDKWDKRSWRSRETIRYDLINLCKEIVLTFDSK